MSFKLTVIGAILLSGALGGGLAWFGPSRGGAVGEVTSDAKDAVRSTLRKLDSRYYERGPDYGVCVADYGRHAIGKTNAEITFACECFDKNVRILSSADRKSAIDALRPADITAQASAGSAAPVSQTTAPALNLLRKCDITPAKSTPTPDFLSMRGTM